MNAGIGSTRNNGLNITSRNTRDCFFNEILNGAAIRLSSPTKECSAVVGNIYP
jgi:hypothetical protein